MKYSGHNLYPAKGKTQMECAALCLHEPECNYWTHNARLAKCWLKKSDRGRSPSTHGSNSGQKSCGVTGNSTHPLNKNLLLLFKYSQNPILPLGALLGQRAPVNQVVQTRTSCSITYKCNADCTVEENVKYSGHNLYTRKGIKGGNQEACAALCYKDAKCKFWTYNPRSVKSVPL